MAGRYRDWGGIYLASTFSMFTAFDHGNNTEQSNASIHPHNPLVAEDVVDSSKQPSDAEQPEERRPESSRSTFVTVAPSTPPAKRPQQVPDPKPESEPPTSPTFPKPESVSSPAFQIVEGKTAPYYTLQSFDAIKAAAINVRGRFLVVDGNFSIEFGKTLRDGSSMRSVDSSWHEIYARRMIPVPFNEETTKAIEMVASKYSRFNPKLAKVYLGVPHRIDQLILKAQRTFLGDQFDVSLTTEVRLNARGCKVTRVVDQGTQ